MCIRDSSPSPLLAAAFRCAAAVQRLTRHGLCSGPAVRARCPGRRDLWRVVSLHTSRTCRARVRSADQQ
eukprot:11770835-Alexandrium_andersonii.AAC.1